MFEYLRLLNVLVRYRTKEEFLSYVIHHSLFSWEEKSKILFVYALMEEQFEGIRRDSGGPYIDHLRSVATISMIHLGVSHADEVLAALLHDATEHFPENWPNVRIREVYGSNVAFLVDIMSKPPLKPGEDEEERIRKYHTRFRSTNKAAVQLKMCDWMHNILTLIYCTPEKQRRKRLEALRYALSPALEHQVLHSELCTALYSPVLFMTCSVPSFVRP